MGDTVRVTGIMVVSESPSPSVTVTEYFHARVAVCFVRTVRVLAFAAMSSRAAEAGRVTVENRVLITISASPPESRSRLDISKLVLIESRRI